MVSGPLTPRQATDRIRQIAAGDPTLHWTIHALERLEERGLTVGDVLQVLRHGMVYEPGLPGKSAAQFRYAIQARAPGSGLREVRVVVGLGASATALKIVTVMWADEPMGSS